jgi:hypothetical protein
MAKSMPGEIHYDKARVTAREEHGSLFLLTLPSGRHYELDATAAKLWRRIEDGCTRISDLVEEHAKSAGLPSEVAAFQVISFLDELRAADFISFQLEKERESAPLLDAELSQLRPRFVKRFNEKSDKLPPIEAVVLDTPNMELRLRDARNVAERVSGKGISMLDRVIAVTAENAELTLTELRSLIDKTDRFEFPGIEVVGNLRRPSPDLVLRDAAGVLTPTADFTSSPGGSVQRVVIIIIITDGPIIIIVIGDGPGPSAGKSRSACKTMCV